MLSELILILLLPLELEELGPPMPLSLDLNGGVLKNPLIDVEVEAPLFTSFTIIEFEP